MDSAFCNADLLNSSSVDVILLAHVYLVTFGADSRWNRRWQTL